MQRSSLGHLKTACASAPSAYPVVAKSGKTHVAKAIVAQARAEGHTIVDLSARMPKPRKDKAPAGTTWYRPQA